MHIQTEDLKKQYGSFKLNILDLKIKESDIFGLVGNNGAGKTTFLRLCLDLIQANDGRVLSGKIDVSKNEDWKEYTGSYLDEGFLIDFLTPEEYFDFVASLHDMSEQDKEKSLARFENLFNGEVLGQ
ncbi:MAG: ATP-binding cassette domain-containing protein, partial [Candidatus Marinimicrobia bacterium]|nr:ATP-binding cassette domain-containing protein [Candidatus Neomarinimicrobiota bacterium]